MSHVTHDLERWLGGELDAAATARLEAHLGECSACRREAEASRAVWQALDLAAAPATAASVWPAVRARTLEPRQAWFFGGRPLLQAGLAAAAVACGLLAASLLPGDGGQAQADGTLYAMSSRALDADADTALDVWLAAGSDDAEVSR